MMRHITDVLSVVPTGFESYFANLQRRNVRGGPSADEARRDYLAALRSTVAVA